VSANQAQNQTPKGSCQVDNFHATGQPSLPPDAHEKSRLARAGSFFVRLERLGLVAVAFGWCFGSAFGGSFSSTFGGSFSSAFIVTFTFSM
jgi:hypothetical protein